jgi:hypothetical protein
MRYLIFITALLITGCSSVPVAIKFPDAPTDMLTACPDLKVTPETAKLSEVLPVVVDNYGQYYTCKDRVDNWIEWYNTQKKIFNSVK